MKQNHEQLMKLIAILFGAILIGMVILPNYYTESFEPYRLPSTSEELDYSEEDNETHTEEVEEEEEHFRSSPSLSYQFLKK